MQKQKFFIKHKKNMIVNYKIKKIKKKINKK